MPKVLNCRYIQSITKAKLHFEEVDSNADNLDDLILDYGNCNGTLVVLENNTASPTTVDGIRTTPRHKTSKSKYVNYSFPDNEYTNSTPLVDYLAERSLCAAEIPVLGGVFIVSELGNY